MVQIFPFLLLVAFVIFSVYLIRNGLMWMVGIILSVVGSVGVMVVCVLTHGGVYPFNEAIICWLVVSTVLLSIGLIMAIHGLKKKQ